MPCSEERTGVAFDLSGASVAIHLNRLNLIADVDAVLRRVSTSLASTALEVKLLEGERAPGLPAVYLVTYTGPDTGKVRQARQLLVFDDWRLTSQSHGTGYLHRKWDHPRPVGILLRGTGRDAAGQPTPTVPGAAFARAQAMADNILEETT